MRVTYKTLIALAAFVGLATTANAADTDWLPKTLNKPLGEITLGFAGLGVGTNSYVATYVDFFNSYVKELGVKSVVLDPQSDPAKQSDQIGDLIAQQVDVMIVWPVNGKAVVPAVKQAHAAGIPIVITNSDIDESGRSYIATYTGPDHYSEALLAGALMAKGLNGKGNVVIIGGAPGYTVSQLREKGFRDAIAKFPDIKVLDSQPANWSREKAQSVMENYITRFGKQIDGVYSADSGMGVGALSAIQAAAKEGKVDAGHIIETDCTLFAVAYDAIKAGEYYGSVLQAPEEDAKVAVQTAILIAEGQTVAKKIYFDTPVITKENIDKFKRPSF
jgi:ribose transport system substrate-binding protein